MAKVIESHSEINSKIVKWTSVRVPLRPDSMVSEWKQVQDFLQVIFSSLISEQRGGMREFAQSQSLPRQVPLRKEGTRDSGGTDGNNIKIVHYENQQWIKRQVREEIEEWTCWKWEEGDWAAISVDVKGVEGKVVGKEGKLRFKNLVREQFCRITDPGKVWVLQWRCRDSVSMCRVELARAIYMDTEISKTLPWMNQEKIEGTG